MALPAKPNHQERLIRELFKDHDVSFSRPEYKELLDLAEKFFQIGIGNIPTAYERYFNDRVKSLAEEIKAEEVEAIHKKKAQERSLQIASERTLAPVRLNNSRLLMALPWFSPDQRLRKDYFEYTSSDGSIKLEVHPSPKCGAAKVWDADILMYALSKAVRAYLETKEFPRSVSFSAYEYLKQANKDAGSGKNLSDIKEKLDRLSLTRYKCSLINPETTKEQSGQNFSLCSASWTNDTQGHLEGIKIAFSEELFQHFATKNDLLSLKKDLLLEAWKEERSGLRKRLLMLVSVHLGSQQLWKVSLKTLQGMCGHNTLLKRFKEALTAIIPSLPWLVDIEKNQKGDQIVTFIPKEESKD